MGRQCLTTHSVLSYRPPRLDERLAPAILIPNAVIEEVRAGQQKDPTATAALAWAAKYRVEDVAVITSIAHWDLCELFSIHASASTSPRRLDSVREQDE